MDATTFLDPATTARRLGIARRTLEQWTARGEGPASVKTSPYRGARRWYPVAAVDLWLAQHRHQTSSTRDR